MEHTIEELATELLDTIHAEAETVIDPSLIPESLYREGIEARDSIIADLKKIIIDIAGEDYLKHKGF